MPEARWIDLGRIEDLKRKPLSSVQVGRNRIALSYQDGRFGAISSVCNHVGGPLAEGRLDGDYVVCPWHNWKFHRAGGQGEPGYEADAVPSYELREEGGRLYLNPEPVTKRSRKPHAPHRLERSLDREPGPIRVLGISTTAMDARNPRYSGSDVLLEEALRHAAGCGNETQLIKLNDLNFRACEGYYSKAARACTWPCSITQMDPDDGMEPVYEAIVFWADVVLVATPIRWGNASSLYYKMAERLNCVQNQVTLRDRVMIRSKVASFIIVGGQDNIQAVAGQMLLFFGELGFHTPQFPFIAHSRGWSAEDMERNVSFLQQSEELREGARGLVDRGVALAKTLIEHPGPEHTERGGRKAHAMGEKVRVE